MRPVGGGGEVLAHDHLKEVLELLMKLAKFSDNIRRNGGGFETYLSARVDGRYPEFLVKIREGNEESVAFFLDESALREFAEANLDLKLFGQNGADEDNGAKRDGGPSRRARLIELHESHAISKLMARLEECGLDPAHFFSMDQPVYELVEGEGDKAHAHPVFSVPAILDTILEIGRRGIEIKRFKGLGEMNAKELFETTMDPEKRRLLQVKFDEDNMVNADRIFTILMGDIVEPRKQFIEDNALNVRNLDV